MYVDDFISGGDSIAETKNIQNEMELLFKKGGFNLRKWSSNSIEILNNIPTNNQESTTCLDICRDDVIKTLGVFWHTSADEFHFKVSPCDPPINQTKRALLSDISKLFDPFGFLAPVIVVVQILF